MLNVHIYDTVITFWISCVSAVISLRLQLNFIIEQEMLSTSFLEKDSSVFDRGSVGGCEWGCKIAFTWAALCPLFSLVEIPRHFIPIILCLNSFYPSLVSFPFFSFTLYILHPPSQLPPFAFHHLFTVLSSSPIVFPIFSRPVLFLSPRCLMDAIRWMDYRNKMIKERQKQKVGEAGWLLFNHSKAETYNNVMEDLSATFPLCTFKVQAQKSMPLSEGTQHAMPLETHFFPYNLSMFLFLSETCSVK